MKTLSTTEARILGAFIEKELTTPDYYPLSLNGLTNACNQKSNRAPVMQLEESEVLDSVDNLRKKGLAMQSQDAGSRVAKYRHTLRERLYLEEAELAILGELLLRGAQTPGELRTRAARMTDFPDLAAVETVLQELMEKDPPLVARLERQPGRKECRYAQLFNEISEDAATEQEQTSANSADEREFEHLKNDLDCLRTQLAELQAEFAEFRKQFE